MSITGYTSSDGVVVGFDSIQSFDRNARAMRYVEERLMLTNGEDEMPGHLPADDKVEVKVTGSIDEDEYYPAVITWFDDVEGAWADTAIEVRAFGLNDEDLVNGDRYLGRVIGHVKKPLVVVSVGGDTTPENSFDMVTAWELDDSTTPCTLVPSLVRTITGRFTVGEEHAPT